ncbi:RNA-guided endonuclease InsQ/TnpB family protein [Salisaeta longa]|uniref:RNA-guided endonuclease InsQ/TnpB family protein n=1 Tax=Salisaeta longa TaxID=503170 RepID=UPI0003B62B92|nr:RNA-guided endonuclease TnpB family protein [Salisaeta longa]
MRYNTAYKFRFYPTAEQKAALAEVFGHTRYVWNWALDLRTQSYYDEGKSLTYTATSKRLTAHKKEKEWLRNVSSVALQQKLRDLEQAFQNFFDGRAGYPNFKRKHGKQTARFASNAFTLDGKRLSVSKVPGTLNVRWSRDLSDSCNVTSVTLTKDPAGRYFVSLTCTEEKKPLPETDRTVGIDLGITDVVVTSDGFKSGNPKYLEDDLYRLRKAQRRLSRKEKGSQNWKKQKRKVARLHAKIADKRNDFLHKLSRKLVDENQVIALESLNVKGMQRREASAVSVQNRSLSRSIADTGWSTLVRYIEYKAEWAGRTVVKIDRWFPSTKRCSACGHVGGTKPLSVRHWQCEECGACHDRDVNAAKNICTVGLAGAQKFLREDCEGRGKPHKAFVRSGHGPVKQYVFCVSKNPRPLGRGEVNLVCC